MSLASIANIPNVHNPADWHQFTFSDMDSHRKIATAIFTQKGIQLPLYILDPPPPLELMSSWFGAEYQLHIDMNGVTGVPGNDLAVVDFNNPEQWATWIRLHWYEHQQNEQILRILG